MYIPRIYKVTDVDVIDSFIRANSFATLVSVDKDLPAATHIPLELDTNLKGEKVLLGHMSKANPQWKTFTNNATVLAIFLSPANHYISSSWYEHPNVPTWNYISVHITGKIRIIEGEELWVSLKKMTDKYETTSAKPVDVNALPEPVKREVDGLVGFEIIIERTEASFKLSQNRNTEDHKNIIQELRKIGSFNATLMANEMEKVTP